MPTFQSRPLPRSNRRSGSSSLPFFNRLVPHVRQRPVLFFGLPFVLTIVGASFGLSRLTQTRYDYNATRVQSVSKQEEIRLKADRKRIDIREEYFKLQGRADELEQWEPKRIARPEGVPEWGVPPTETSSQSPLQPRDYTRIPSVIEPGEERKSGSAKDVIILDKDGKPCRACNSKLAFSQALKGATKAGTGKQGSKGSASTAVAGMGAAAAAATPNTTEECPPDGPALGRATWTFLHSAAAYYPANPSPAEQEEYARLDGLVTGAKSTGETDAEGRARTTLDEAVRAGGPVLARWLCGVHNEVNARLGKPVWRCDEQTLRQRWKDGPPDGRCD